MSLHLKRVLSTLTEIQAESKKLKRRKTSGLCSIVRFLHLNEQITEEEYESFMWWLDERKDHQNVFFTFEGVKTTEKDQFMWPAWMEGPRNEFVEEQIEELTDYLN